LTARKKRRRISIRRQAQLAGDAGGLSISIYDLRASLVSSAALKTLTANQPPQRHASLYAIEQRDAVIVNFYAIEETQQ